MSVVAHVAHVARRRSASPVTRAAVQQCVDAIDTAAEAVFAALATMAAAMVDAWNDRGGPFTTADIVRLQPPVFDQLDRNSSFDSAGYVMSEAALADQVRHLEWWHRGDHGTYLPLILTVEPGAADCYDYYAMEWFRAAIGHRRRFASGPKIDLPCASVPIITFTHPVIADGMVLGVAGADVALSRYEAAIRPPLQRLPAPAVLLNSERRVITSNDPSWTTGEKLRRLPTAADGAWQVVEPVTPDLGWLVAVGPALTDS